MDSVTALFREAVETENGYKLSESITPVAPPEDAGRLYAFHRSMNIVSTASELRNNLIYKSSAKFSKPEQNAWIDLYTAYWKAIGELLAVEEAQNQRKKPEWKKVFDAWKEVVNCLLRGYTSNSFESWTIPCMYVVGKYLRNFAIKADEQLRQSEGNVNFANGLSDDIASGLGKNDCLQDAAQQVNRIFSVCITDRYASTSTIPVSLYSSDLLRVFFYVPLLSLVCVGLRLKTLENGASTT